MTKGILRLRTIGVACCAITLAGCATMKHGSKQMIRVTTTPSDADVLINGVKSDTTPARIAVRRNRNIVLRVEKDGYEPAEVALVRRTSGWVAADVLWSLSQFANQGYGSGAQRVLAAVGILIGSVAVDHLTGAAYVQKPETIHVALRPAAGAATNSPAERSIEVIAKGPSGDLAGTLTLPDQGEPPFPAVVTVTGSGAHRRDGNRTSDHPYRPFRDIARALAGCGIATLRLDDRGAGASSGDASAATAEDTAADVRAALSFLRARSDIDPRRLALVGHSYGGVVAPMVAAEDDSLAAVVLLGAPARNFRETMRYQHRYRIENDLAIPAEGREAALEEAMRAQEANVAASRDAWRRSIQDRDPLTTARQLKMPVLLLQGETDRAVDPEDARLLEEAIRAGGNRNVQRTLFPGVNHHFQRDPVGAREGYDRLPTQDLAPEVLSTLCSWLPKTLK